MSELLSQLELQIRVSKTLSIGFMFTVWPLAWLTAGIAIVIGAWAMGVINESREPLAGKVIAWWCIVVGSLECLWMLVKLLVSV